MQKKQVFDFDAFQKMEKFYEKKERELLGDQMYDALKNPEKLGEIVTKAFNEEVFDRKATQKVMMSTGHGGCKEMIKVICKTHGLAYNFKNFLAVYRYLIESGQMKVWRQGRTACYQFS